MGVEVVCSFSACCFRAMQGELARAEQLLLQQGLVEEAMEMYQELHKWEESITVAEQRQHPEVSTLKSNYLQWLTETGQEEKAAELKEKEGDLVTAVHLFLKGGLPARAAAIVSRYDDCESFQPALLETASPQPSSALAHSSTASPPHRYMHIHIHMRVHHTHAHAHSP